MRASQFLYILAFILFSCRNENSGKEVLPDSTFVKFYADSLIMAEEALFLKMDKNEKIKRVESLYEKYNITQEKVSKTLEFLKGDLERWKTFNEKVVKQLDLMQQTEIENRKM